MSAPALTPAVIPIRRGQIRVDCPQCGHQQAVDRAGRFRDGDFYELWHERCELEARIKELERENARLHHLWSTTSTWADLHRASAQLFADAWERAEIERDRAVARYWENG